MPLKVQCSQSYFFGLRKRAGKPTGGDGVKGGVAPTFYELRLFIGGKKQKTNGK
jgi:hypothetical protein